MGRAKRIIRWIKKKIFRKKTKTEKSKVSSKAAEKRVRAKPSAPVYVSFSVNSGFFRPNSKQPRRVKELCNVSMK